MRTISVVEDVEQEGEDRQSKGLDGRHESRRVPVGVSRMSTALPRLKESMSSLEMLGPGGGVVEANKQMSKSSVLRS
ncbi:hypothetical protein CC1G_14152 [Coprinopsis cinerea okayama7|uniref:Uncharacterized protein n=1 Tax=Coprinopsis cinerea (strain Okayama-7 / 130 / ATCC MYA-4618 / FGSC 9003) TaxID=240176 RepID=D6RLL3_COPC7|nr:hypothetical protein CC1G_14152 [Coprinopsis cinerea okayama7\|eukprot:XP_002911619.1 hypothetical protein CC1G_14152 [Coprinopsis cinerea okayama7\